MSKKRYIYLYFILFILMVSCTYDFSSPISCITIGDSICWYDGHQGADGRGIVKGYQYYIRNKLNWNIQNYAVSGASISLIENNEYEDIVETVRDIDFAEYDVVLVMGGINDFRNRVPLGNADDRSITTFYGAYCCILNTILRSNPDIKIILATPLPTYELEYHFQFCEESVCLSDYVDIIYEIAEIYSLPVLDLFQNSKIDETNCDLYMMDGLHLNNLGYEFVSNSYVIPFLNKVFSNGFSEPNEGC